MRKHILLGLAVLLAGGAGGRLAAQQRDSMRTLSDTAEASAWARRLRGCGEGGGVGGSRTHRSRTPGGLGRRFGNTVGAQHAAPLRLFIQPLRVIASLAQRLAQLLAATE